MNIPTVLEEAQERLREILPEGSTVYVVQRRVAASGMSRRVTLHAIVTTNGHTWLQNITILVGRATGFPLVDAGGRWELRVTGAGMDMHFHVVHTLAHRLYGDGYALTKETI